MREFFIKTLKELRATTGSRQMEFLSPEETKLILDKLCMISKQFGYIPEERQMGEVEKQIIEDMEFQGLNPKIFYKWMFKIADPYWKSRLTEEDLTPQEIAPPEIADKYIREWQELINKADTKFTEKGSGGGSRLRESLDKLAKSEEPITNQKFFIGEVCPMCQGKGGFEVSDKVCPECNGIGEIDHVEVMAMNEAEARRAYNGTFK